LASTLPSFARGNKTSQLSSGILHVDSVALWVVYPSLESHRMPATSSAAKLYRLWKRLAAIRLYSVGRLNPVILMTSRIRKYADIEAYLSKSRATGETGV
jgi:hypothetical protein